MTDVRLSGRNNSQIFTTCCGLAITDGEQTCPGCEKDVYPFYEGMPEAERDEYAGGYFNEVVRNMRWKRAFRG